MLTRLRLHYQNRSSCRSPIRALSADGPSSRQLSKKIAPRRILPRKVYHPECIRNAFQTLSVPALVPAGGSSARGAPVVDAAPWAAPGVARHRLLMRAQLSSDRVIT